MKIDPRDFLINTDYEMDKIIYSKELTYTVSEQSDFSIPHNLKTIPLIFGIWSINPDFTDSHSIGAYDDPWNLNMFCSAFGYDDHIGVELVPRMSGEVFVPTTFYIKIWAFEPKSKHDGMNIVLNSQVPSTSKEAKIFILNTDYNYLKLLTGGDLPTENSSDNSKRYRHGLGYVPQIMCWYEDFYTGTGLQPYNDAPSYSLLPGIDKFTGTFIDDQYVINPQMETRVYVDEA